MTNTNRTNAPVADICLYGTTHAGWLAIVLADGHMLGTGDPIEGQSTTEAIWSAVDALRKAGVDMSRVVRIFESGGRRVAQCRPRSTGDFANLTWRPAPVYTLSVEAIINAAEQEGR